MKRLFFSALIILISIPVFAEELPLSCGKTYLMNFDKEITNINADKNQLEAQILHTIFNDKKQLIISLKCGNNAILQVKTEDNVYDYELKNSKKASKKLIEIDIPPLENLDVDVYEGV